MSYIPRAEDEWPRVLRCTGCGELIAADDAIPSDDGVPFSECCDAVCTIPQERPSLEQRYGPAWATFIAVPHALLAYRGLRPSERIVVVALLDYLDLRAAYPSHERLAAETGLAVRTVRTALGVLEGMGWIRRRRRWHPNGSRASDLIDLRPLVDALHALPANPAARTGLTANPAEPNGKSCQGLPARIAEDLEVDTDDQEPIDLDRPSAADFAQSQPDEAAAALGPSSSSDELDDFLAWLDEYEASGASSPLDDFPDFGESTR